MRSSDHERLLDFVGELHGSLELDELRADLLDALSRLVRCDWCSLNDVAAPPEPLVVLIEPAAPDDLRDAWIRLGHQNPLIERFQRTADGRPYRFSDVVSPAELRALPLYREVYAPLGVEHQIAFVVRTEPDRFLGLALSRGAPDFTDGERALLDRARPFIVQAYRNALIHTRSRDGGPARSDPGPDLSAALRSAGLSAREAEVVGRLAVGRSVAVIAQELGVTPRTVHKHQQGAYAKLGVTSRTDAARAAWNLVVGPG